MSIKILIVFFLIFTACQSGRIPCPEPSMVKVKQSNPNRQFFAPPAAYSANAEETSNQNIHEKHIRKSDGRKVKNVTVEEWDCPRPGAKKYLPRSVKENIRKNMKRIKDENGANTNADTVRVNGSR